MHLYKQVRVQNSPEDQSIISSQSMPRRSASNSASNSPPRRPRQTARKSPTPEQSPPKQPQEHQEEELKLYVSGLAPDANKEDLRDSFQEFGEITDVFVINKANFSFGFVTFDNSKSAREAKETMAGKEIGGKPIGVAFAKPRPERGAPRGNQRGRGRGCFKCGEEGHFARECPNAENQGNERSQRKDFKSRDNNRYQRADSNSESPRRRPRRSPSASPPRRKVQKRSTSGSQSPGNNRKRGGKMERSRSPVGRRSRRRSPSSSGSRGRR